MRSNLAFMVFYGLGLVAGAASCAPRLAVPMPSSASVDRPAIRAPSSTARSWFLRARIAESRGDLEEAERALRWVVREDGQAVSHDHLAGFYMRTRRWDDARRTWQRSLQQDPERWQPHAALASLDKRAGEAEAERAHLERAVALRADAMTHERLAELQLQTGETDHARLTLRRWHSLPLTDPVLQLRRARMGLRLQQPAPALDDLISVAQHDRRAPDVAELIVDTAAQSCRWHTAWEWARQADLDDPFVRREARRLATRVGDPELLERTFDVDLPPPPDVPARAIRDGIDLDVPSDTPRIVAAALWRGVGRPERALLLVDPIEDAPWARLIAALAHADLMREEQAWQESLRIPEEHRAWAYAQVLGLGLGRVQPGTLQTWLQAHPDRAGDLASAAAELHHMPALHTRLVQVKGLRLHTDAPPAPDGVLRIPAEHAGSLDRVLTTQAIRATEQAGHRAESRRLADAWVQRRPDDPHAWLALAEASPERADAALAKAMDLDACHGPTLVRMAHQAPPGDEVTWLRRAQEADPLSQVVHQALTRRGLGAR